MPNRRAVGWLLGGRGRCAGHGAAATSAIRRGLGSAAAGLAFVGDAAISVVGRCDCGGPRCTRGWRRLHQAALRWLGSARYGCATVRHDRRACSAATSSTARDMGCRPMPPSLARARFQLLPAVSVRMERHPLPSSGHYQPIGCSGACLTSLAHGLAERPCASSGWRGASKPCAQLCYIHPKFSHSPLARARHGRLDTPPRRHQRHPHGAMLEEGVARGEVMPVLFCHGIPHLWFELAPPDGRASRCRLPGHRPGHARHGAERGASRRRRLQRRCHHWRPARPAGACRRGAVQVRQLGLRGLCGRTTWPCEPMPARCWLWSG